MITEEFRWLFRALNYFATDRQVAWYILVVTAVSLVVSALAALAILILGGDEERPAAFFIGAASVVSIWCFHNAFEAQLFWHMQGYVIVGFCLAAAPALVGAASWENERGHPLRSPSLTLTGFNTVAFVFILLCRGSQQGPETFGAQRCLVASAPSEACQQECERHVTLACYHRGLQQLGGSPVEAHRSFQQACSAERVEMVRGWVHWYRRGLIDPRACYQLGMMEASAGERGEAIQHLRRACRQGVGAACTVLGQRLASGWAGDSNRALGLGLLERRCALLADPDCVALGEVYARGEGVAIDQGRAMTYFEKSCALHNEGSCLARATLLLELRHPLVFLPESWALPFRHSPGCLRSGGDQFGKRWSCR